ncbi:hypothetical protein ACFQ4O_11780 [Methylopila musalis]|uniref:Uncharacterized protein n=1 Tax=Methylopila musalis TaxID=1134781 RepID=A0ABW3Z9K9_9HYPH
MGIAFGAFTPSDHYNRNLHANVLNGQYVDDRGLNLSLRSDVHGVLSAVSVAISEGPNADDEKEATLFFRERHLFDSLFSKHPEHRTYYNE